MTQHNINDRFTYGKYDIILGYGGYRLQEVATGHNPLWWDADNFIGGFPTLENAEAALVMIMIVQQVTAYDLKQALFALKGI